MMLLSHSLAHSQAFFPRVSPSSSHQIRSTSISLRALPRQNHSQKFFPKNSLIRSRSLFPRKFEGLLCFSPGGEGSEGELSEGEGSEGERSEGERSEGELDGDEGSEGLGDLDSSGEGTVLLDGIPLDQVDWDNYWKKALIKKDDSVDDSGDDSGDDNPCQTDYQYGKRYVCIPCSKEGHCIFFVDRIGLMRHSERYHLIPKFFGSTNVDCPLCYNTFPDEQHFEKEHLPKCAHLPDSMLLKVSNLHPTVNDETLKARFEKYNIEDAIVVRHTSGKRRNKSKGFGFLKFKIPLDLANALRYERGEILNKKKLDVVAATDAEAKVYQKLKKN